MKSVGQLIGERLYLARTKRDMTMDQLSAKAGISQPNISRLESGRHDPSASTIAKLAAALSVDPCWLAYGTGTKPDWLSAKEVNKREV